MSEVQLLIDYSLCSGCKICQLVCSQKKSGSYNPSQALLRIIEKNEVYHTPVVCMQCENPACLRVCPTGAISNNSEHIVLVDAEKCTGCGICKKYCPQDVLVLVKQENTSKRKVQKCDLCEGSPECASACPTGALKIVKR